jgi:putative PIN family toxin of toxin-antitoxin system
MIRAVVDAGVFIRGTLSQTGGSAFIIQAFKHRDYVLITSRVHMEEIFRTLGSSRLQRHYALPDKLRKRLVGTISALGLVLQPSGALQVCRDPTDDYLIELALLGRADYLITEDADLYADHNVLLFLAQRQIQVLRVAEFVRTLRGSPSRKV